MKISKNISILFLIAMMGCHSKPGTLLKIINLPNYPSASGLATYKNNHYLVGDDATSLWILDTNYHKSGQINLYPSAEKRINKNTKEDLEALTVVAKMDSVYLLALGSGSTAQRKTGWKINIKDSFKTSFSLSVFYKRLEIAGIKEVNIEAVTATEQGFILANRGNYNYPMNYLIITSPDFFIRQETAPISLVKFGFQKDSSFLGISGLTYSHKSGHLYGTLSTEFTTNSFTDGIIGSSSVFILKDVLQKQKLSAVNPDTQIDLKELNKKFTTQKIEAVSILKEEINVIKLLLASDNDDGKSTLFEVEINPKK